VPVLLTALLVPIFLTALLVPVAVRPFTHFWAAIPVTMEAMLFAAPGQPHHQGQNRRGNQGHQP
jgi:hypothetical protein